MEKQELMELLEERFLKHMERHRDMEWERVKAALNKSDKLDILMKMEETGGEPDVVLETEDAYVFYDCSRESPMRRSVCYDEAALQARKKNKPKTSAEAIAKIIGAEIIDEKEYFHLQSLGDFDVKSQSWIATDREFREKGDALFGTKQHGRTFIYYNGAGSYYRVRGFRCKSTIEK